MSLKKKCEDLRVICAFFVPSDATFNEDTVRMKSYHVLHLDTTKVAV